MKTLRNLSALLVLSLISVLANAQSPLTGRWRTEDNATVEFAPCGTALCAKQLSAVKEADKKINGKTIAKEVAQSKENHFTGIVIDPEENKEYKATWELAKDGKTLLFKVKWGLMSFSEKWFRMK